uniref:Replication origin-binding protein domain-containing protein n=1 Tax=Tolypothrix bouteillei VB521301 TaxID=1479485 RepID=A0A0C1QLH5_9CYAN
MSFSKNFYPTNRNEECFCGDKSGKCRHSKDDPNFKACMTFRDARLGQREGDWICVLEMAAEWSYWRLASSIELKSPEFREAAREAKKQQAVEKEKAKGFAIANELPAEQRHEQYSKIQSKKVLIPDHRENLLKRGFTLEQIIEIGYWSIRQPWEKVLGYYDTKLPGFVRFTEEDATLNAAVRAIVCPVRQLGQIVGLKMRLDDAPENGGRYRWLTGKTQKNPEGATPHIYGELPLAVLEATDPTKQGIWVTEGNEIKPVLVNYKLGYAVLGGGRFWQSSPNHAAKFLPIMRERYGNQITLCPDAGDILNKNVAPKWLSEYEFFKSQGFEVRFAWWGQTTKEHDDIDELENYDQIEFIDDTAFKALIEEHSETAKTAKKEWLDDYNEKQFHNWLDARKFDPDITIDDNDPNFKFPKNLPNEQAIISILSPMGTGKTHAMIEDIKTLESRTNKGAILIGYRNTLLKQTIQRALTVGVTIHLLKKKDSDDVQELLKTPYAHLACCLDSIFKLDGHFTGRDIYIDESCSVILHGLNGGTLKGRQAEILAMFKRAIQECNRIVLLDGNQSDFFTSIIAQIAPDKKVVKVLKKKQVVPQNFIFVETIGTSEEEIKKHDRSPLINIALQPNEKPFIFADSKVFTESLGRVLENEGKKGNVLNQNSVSEPWADLFLTDPNKFIEETQPDFQIISPSGESGLSVDIKNYFTCKLSFLSGVLTTNSQRQGLNRLRDTSVTHYVHCPERTAIRDHKIPPYYAAKQIHEVLTKRLNQSAILATHSADCKESATEIMMTQIEKSIKEDIFYEFSLKLFALENFERNNLRKCLMYTLKEEGHTVELVKEVSCKATNDKTEEAKEEYLEEEAAAIFKAQPLEEEEFKKYEKVIRLRQNRLLRFC